MDEMVPPGYFGRIEKRFAEAAAKLEIKTLQEAQQVLQYDHERIKAKCPLAAEEVIIDFIPEEKTKFVAEEMKPIALSDFPCLISCCHIFSWTPHDKRRTTSLMACATSSDPQLMTGSIAKCHMLPENPAGKELTFVPRLLKKEDVDAVALPDEQDVEEAAIVPAESSEIAINARTISGWRTSFKQEDGQDVAPSLFRKRLERKLRVLGELSDKMLMAGRTNMLQAAMAISDERAAKRKHELDQLTM